MIALIDETMGFLPPLLRIALWGIASAAISMSLYARLSPQEKMAAVKQQQKEARRRLLRHDGDWDELGVLIRQDLALSVRQLAMTLLPFAVSVAPLFFIMDGLEPRYPGQYLSSGPDWMHGLEFCYITVVLLCSLAIKFLFRIA